MIKINKIFSLESLAIILLLCGVLFAGKGIYIKAKAMLAQVLLEQAWKETLAFSQSDSDRHVSKANHSEQIKPWPWADTWPVAKLIFPDQNIQQIVLAGASGESLAFGPAHHTGTALPGENGNIIISGHRDTHFSFLKNVKKDQIIEVETITKKETYFVKEMMVIDTNKIPYIPTDNHDKLILITCYPFDAIQGGATLRYMITASSVN